MSLPKCFSLLNTSYFENLSLSLTAIGASIPENATLEELEAIGASLQTEINDVFAQLSLLESNITSQLALISPLLALLTAPTNPAQLITWVSNFITSFLTPYVIPYATMTAQLAALSTQVATLTSEIEALASTKLPGITITVPSITIGCTL